MFWDKYPVLYIIMKKHIQKPKNPHKTRDLYIYNEIMEKYPIKPRKTRAFHVYGHFLMYVGKYATMNKNPVKRITRRYKRMLFYTGILYHIVLKTGIIILYVIILCVIIIYVMKQPI